MKKHYIPLFLLIVWTSFAHFYLQKIYPIHAPIVGNGCGITLLIEKQSKLVYDKQIKALLKELDAQDMYIANLEKRIEHMGVSFREATILIREKENRIERMILEHITVINENTDLNRRIDQLVNLANILK